MKEDKNNYLSKRFQLVRYEDYWNFSNQQTSLEYDKVFNAWSIYFTFLSANAGMRNVTCRCNETVKRRET